MARGRKKERPKTAVGESLRVQIMGSAAPEEFKIGKRDVHVMTRLSESIVEIVDALVTLNVFKSRSEVLAAYLENAVLKNTEMYMKIVEQARTVEGMRDTAMETVLDSLQNPDE